MNGELYMYKKKKRKLSNRSRILECVYRLAPVARTEIADETDITPATVTANVTALIGEGIIKELGEVFPEENSSGRKRVLLDINPLCGYCMGVEFTQKALVICLTDMKGQVVGKKEKAFDTGLAERITQEIAEGLECVLSEAHVSWIDIIGVGIAVPGHMDLSCTHLITNRKTWESFSPERLEARIPVPVVYENNARCMSLGEYLFHPEKAPDNFAFFHVGMGMYCAHVIDGELFLGNQYVAGEIGHTIVNESGRRCECGKYGCLQTYSSENWILKNARLLYRNHPKTYLRLLADSEEEINITHVTTAYSMGDEAVGTYISDALKYLGITISNIAIIMNPGKIFLHGQLFDNEEIRMELMDYIGRQLLFVDSSYMDHIEILPYALSDGAIGGSALAVARLFL